MRNGFKIIDIDTHVNPSYDTLVKYLDPGARSRVAELQPFVRTRGYRGETATRLLTVAPYPFDRFPGEAPKEAKVVAGGKGALEGRVTSASSHHRVPPAVGVMDENVHDRIKDMDTEGRDIDFLIPGTWATAASGLPDVTLAEALYRSYHNYIAAYCQPYLSRLRSMVLVPGGDVEWAVREVKRLKNEPWVAAVWPLLPEGKPIDHPDLAPLWDVMNDAHLPIFFHSFFYEPPYFPGYRDIWGNAVVARTAAHPWGAARLLSYLIVGQIFDRYPNINAGVAEVGHGWLPHWVIRLGEMIRYVSGATPPLKYQPIEYVQMGRFRCGAEPFEGPAITKAVIDILGPGALMHQSDYPHGEAHFPDTAQMVLDWPIWNDFGREALQQHMAGNAEKFLRMA
jgi:predicted TIM-barrel fold metal-dependent hydrolase